MITFSLAGLLVCVLSFQVRRIGSLIYFPVSQMTGLYFGTTVRRLFAIPLTRLLKPLYFLIFSCTNILQWSACVGAITLDALVVAKPALPVVVTDGVKPCYVTLRKVVRTGRVILRGFSFASAYNLSGFLSISLILPSSIGLLPPKPSLAVMAIIFGEW